MASRAAGDFGNESHEYYNRHRFANPSAWLDQQDRNRKKAEGKPLGYGFPVPKPQPPPREEKPFTVVEPSFTSGWMCHRKYNQFASGYATDNVRTDPYHYPNALEVKDADHYKDNRRRSQNCDPHTWKPDPKLKDVVSDEMVQQHLLAHKGETRAKIDAAAMEPLFNDMIRPNPDGLNVDLSCADLRENGGRGSTSRTRASGGSGHEGSANVEGHLVSGKPEWKWCLGGRKLMEQSEPTPEEVKLIRSQSLPQMFSTTSTLSGNIGGDATAFHGLNTRKFGIAHTDPRMRGGKLARDGWAGTFPAKEAARVM